MSTNSTTKKPDLTRVEWLVWFAITAGIFVIYFTIGQRPAPPSTVTTTPAFALAGLAPLVLSVAVRWLVLPRFTDPQKRFPLFVIGIALAEGCGLLGIFLGGPHKETLFILSLIALAQFFPALLPRSDRRASSFR
jgi:hypothetical protein